MTFFAVDNFHPLQAEVHLIDAAALPWNLVADLHPSLHASAETGDDPIAAVAA